MASSSCAGSASSPGWRATPVIFYTATYHEREARALAQQCGVVDILTKPSEPATILAKVDRGARVWSTGCHAGGRIAPDVQSRSSPRRELGAGVEGRGFEASEQRMAAIVGLLSRSLPSAIRSVLLDKVCAAAREVTLAQHAVIMMLRTTDRHCRPLVTSGIDHVPLSRMDGGAGRRAAVHSGRSPSVGAVRLSNSSGRPEALGLPAESSADLFVAARADRVADSRATAVWAFGNKLGAEGFSDRDEEVALTLATHAGIAYENARLYDDLRAAEPQHSNRRWLEAAARRDADTSSR